MTEKIEFEQDSDNQTKSFDPNENDYDDEIYENLNIKIFKSMSKIFLRLALITVIYVRLNYLSDTSNLSESHLTLKNFFVKHTKAHLQTPEKFLTQLLHLFNQTNISDFDYFKRHKENYTKDYIRHPISSLKFKIYSHELTNCDPDKKLPFDHLFLEYVEKSVECKPGSFDTSGEFINETICSSVSFDYYNQGFSHKENFFSNFLKYISSIDCEDLVDEIVNNCDGYHILLEDITDKSKTIDCIVKNYEIKSIKYEFNLFNYNLKQFIYLNFFILYLPSTGKLDKIQIDVIDFEKSLLLFGIVKDFYLKLICLIVILCLYFVDFSILLKTFYKNKMSVITKLSNILLLMIVIFLTRLFYIEFRIFHQSKKIKSFFDEPNKYHTLYEIAYFYQRFDLIIGMIYFFACLDITIYMGFNTMISNIITTFHKSYRDLIGFFIIFFGLILSYSLELQFLYGGGFTKFSTFKKCFAALFQFLWGEIKFFELVEYDGKSFFFLMSYLIVMVIIMFNLMLAIILGTYEMVKRDPTCHNSSLKLDKYFFLVTERVIKTYFGKYAFFLSQIVNFRSRNRLYCIQDVEHKLNENGFDKSQVESLLKELKLSSENHVNSNKVESLIRRMFEIEYNHKPKLRINNEELADEYVTNDEWKKLLISYNFLENSFTIIEKRLDLLKNYIDQSSSKFE